MPLGRAELEVFERISEIEYCWSKPYSVHSAEVTLDRNKGHCVDTMFASAYLMEKQGYPPVELAMYLWGEEGWIGHTSFIFRKDGELYTFGNSCLEDCRSRLEGIAKVQGVVDSYADAFAGHGMDLDSWKLLNINASGLDWRCATGDLSYPLMRHWNSVKDSFFRKESGYKRLKQFFRKRANERLLRGGSYR